MLKLKMLKHILTCAALCGFAMGVSADVRAVPRHVFSMSCKVTSCNADLSTPAGRERAIGWFRTNHITKLWLESYRHTESVPTERLIEERDAFHKAGFTVCGMITPTQLNAPGKDGKRPMVVCWSDPEARARLRVESVRAAGVFDTVILGDFLCGAERLGFVGGADGVSRHRFRKNGRTYLARLNTTDKSADGLPPHGFDFCDEVKVQK